MISDDSTERNEVPQSDSLTSGVAFMMGVTVAQRGVGFLRTAIFCRLLPEQELGQWSLVFSFVVLFAPLSVLGITGSFGRYVEHYLQNGQLRSFFSRTATVVTVLSLSVVSLLLFGQHWVSWAIFGSSQQSDLVLPACLTLLSTIACNYFHEMAIAMRRIRVGVIMELISSWTFALLGIALIRYTDLGSYGAVLSYAGGNLLAVLYGAIALRTGWSELPSGSSSDLTHFCLWQKVAPFALGLWLINIVANLFDMVDRYMIVHFSTSTADQAQGMVGQYFSSLAVPLLLVGISTNLAHLVMPYLSEDWEAGRYAEVSKRVNTSMKLVGLLLAMGSACIMIISPLLFGVVFAGKFDDGLAVLPWTVTFCFLNGMITLVLNYLFCVERTKLACGCIAIGLAANILLNILLLPHYGILGAALATASGCAVSLACILFFAVRMGFELQRGVYPILVFPLVLSLGPHFAAVAMICLLWISVRTHWLLSAEEIAEMEGIIQGMTAKLFGRSMPASA